jgi:hydroxymethylbilane synthase
LIQAPTILFDAGTINVLNFGTRGSALALWQTQYVIDLLKAALPTLEIHQTVISTRGDQVLDKPLPLIGGKGVFTAELEAALREKRIDCAVHSLKDLPTDPPDGLMIGAITPRANPADVIISREGYTLATLPTGAVVGTSSRRRAAQILHKRPDLIIRDIRGNVDTRIRKAFAVDGGYDAIVLAAAGVERLGRGEVVTEMLDFNDVLPAPGQGAIAVQTRADFALLQMLAPIHDLPTALAVTAERAFLTGLGGGCTVPVAAYAHLNGERLSLRGRVCSTDGTQQIELSAAADAADVGVAQTLGWRLAQQALDKGAKTLMEQHP